MSSDFEPCMINQLDLFRKKPVQSCITGRMVQKLKPLSALPKSPDVIEFMCPGRPLHFMDINNIALRLSINMVWADDNDLTATDLALSITDAPLHSLFNQCEVYLSEQPVTKSPHLYHYKAILDLHMTSDENARKGMLSSIMYVPDTYSTTSRSAFDERQLPFRESKKVELMGKIRPDICHVEDNAYILDQVPIRVRLTVNAPDVYMLANEANKKGKIQFHDCELHIPYYIANPELSLGLEQMLSHQNASYRFKGTTLKTFLHSSGSVNLNIPVAFSGKLPSSILLTAVKASHFNGSHMSNPFRFDHCGFQEISFICNGNERRYVMDTSNPYGCTSVLRSLYTELGMDYEEASGNVFNVRNINDGAFACAVDLTADRSGTGPSQNIQEYGTVSVQGRLNTALNEPICIILYAKYDSVLEINASREVTVL